MLDYYVVLYSFFNFNKFIWFIIFLFLPSIFWEASDAWLRIILLFFFSLGAYYTISILFKIWSWFKSIDNDKYRISFIKKIKDFSVLSRVWHSIWKSKQLTPYQENKYFSIFIEHISNYKKQNKFQSIAKLLNDFESFYENRSFELNLATKEGLQNLFRFHFTFWKCKRKIKKDKGSLYLITRTLEKVFEKNWIILIKYKYSYLFIDAFIKHINKHTYDISYLKTILSIFFDFIFAKTPKDFIRHDYIDYITIPNTWKINFKNLTNNQNKIIPHIFLEKYKKRMFYRVREKSESKDYDHKFDEFTIFLFPDIDPIRWGRLFIIYCYGRSIERLEQVIDKNWNIGHIGRSFAFTGNNIEKEMEKRYDKEKKETFRLAQIAFDGLFTKQRINKYLEKINNLIIKKKYVDSQKDKKHLEALEYLFKEFKQFLKNE